MNYDIKIALKTISGTLCFGIYSKADYDITEGKEPRLCVDILRKYCTEPQKFDMLPFFEWERLCTEYSRELEELTQKMGQRLRVPESMMMRDPDMPRNLLPSHTIAEKIVYDYTGIDFIRQDRLNWLLWLQFLCDGVKYNLSGSKEGVEILNSAYDEMFVPFDRDSFLGRK